MPQSKLIDINTIKAEPTKDLFITMLVKDITLRDAIGDLVDNSVDAAKSIAANPSNLTGFRIEIILDKNHFEIVDNCSGLEAEDARNNAFYFGKPENFKPGKHTIGQFGIGMKRAFFKIGNYITVKSIASTSSFEMHIDVPSWRKNDNWNFQFDTIKEKVNNPWSKTGLDIHINNLQPDTLEKFTDKQFINDLKREIALEHLYSINQGLEILINNEPLEIYKLTLIQDNKKGIDPVYWKYKFKGGLTAEIIAGISDDNGAEGGWYIFCNDRLILGPDTTEITGWSGSGAKELPRYHDQFYRFRGYVFFNADNSALLPWNTSKTSMDLDSPDWLYVRNQMIILGKQVKKLMDDMKKERERGNPEENQKLSNAVKSSTVKSVNIIMNNKSSLPQIFKYPEKLLTTAEKGRKSGTKITFYKSNTVIKKAMNFFRVDDADTAGEKAFNYFYENEIGE
jgi:hypothetical protein